MMVNRIKNKYKRKIKKQLLTGLFVLVKGLGVPLIIVVVIFILVCYITDILYIGITNEDRSNMKEEMKYYTTEEYTEEDTSIFFASVNDFISGIFGGEIIENVEFPVLGDYTITSYYGYRTAPTAGASTFHSGLDIAAVPGTKLIALTDGKVIKASWGGAGGYTIIIDAGEYSFTYSHCDPRFLVRVGDNVKKGQVIGKIGPKNVYGIANNPYKDANGKPTNRCYNRSTLSFRSKEKWCVYKSIRNFK